MMKLTSTIVCCAAALASPSFSESASAQVQVQPAMPGPSYAAVARQVVGAPLILDARIRDADRIKAEDAVGLAPGRARFLVTADVAALIRGPGGIPTRVEYLADVPLDARGRAPKLKKQRVLLFANPVAGRPAQIQLAELDSQMLWTPALDAMVRGITREVLAADAPPAVTGVGEAFHVAGTLPGEGETQVFIALAGGGQASLQILRRPGQQPRWSVSLGDFIDESASVPARDTLLWFRLACGLPRTLPDASLDSNDPANAAIAREDYALVLRELGPCA